MTHNEEIELEIRRLAHRLKGACIALFELPYKIYATIQVDNVMRKKPYRVSERRIHRVISQMIDCGELKPGKGPHHA